MTANTLFEAVEPMTLWKLLFKSVQNELLSDRISIEVSGLEVRYVLTF